MLYSIGMNVIWRHIFWLQFTQIFCQTATSSQDCIPRAIWVLCPSLCDLQNDHGRAELLKINQKMLDRKLQDYIVCIQDVFHNNRGRGWNSLTRNDGGGCLFPVFLPDSMSPLFLLESITESQLFYKGFLHHWWSPAEAFVSLVKVIGLRYWRHISSSHFHQLQRFSRVQKNRCPAVYQQLRRNVITLFNICLTEKHRHHNILVFKSCSAVHAVKRRERKYKYLISWISRGWAQHPSLYYTTFGSKKQNCN